jgi:DNA modification methylase
MPASNLYTTKLGQLHNCTIEDYISSESSTMAGRVDLIFTSPPFPLINDKEYGNKQGQDYLQWLVHVFTGLSNLVKEDGSLVVEIGNAWNPSEPSMSLWTLKTLIAIAEQCNLTVCQQFVWENPNRLPGPAAWVTKNRFRLKDSHTHVWWFSKSPHPKVFQQNVLKPYSPAMDRLLKRGSYNHGSRPSEHVIGEKSFLQNHTGSIPGSTFTLGNSQNSKQYVSWCNERHLCIHPARMPQKLASFFIEFLTEPGDIVFDPFSGSCTTGLAAEDLCRKWVGTECCLDYALGSYGRFEQNEKVANILIEQSNTLRAEIQSLQSKFLSGGNLITHVQNELLRMQKSVTRPTIKRMIDEIEPNADEIILDEYRRLKQSHLTKGECVQLVHDSLVKQGYSVSINVVKSKMSTPRQK